MRLLAVSVALAMVATIGLVAMPVGHAAFIAPGLTVANSKYWGLHTFVPGEVMTITVHADAADSITITIQDTSGTPTFSTSIIMPTSTIRYVNWTVNTGWPDGNTYRVTAQDTTSGTAAVPIAFTIRQYDYRLYTDRPAYVPGDTVTLNWLVFYRQNYTVAPAGVGAFQVHDSTGANLLSTSQVSITAADASSSFAIAANQTAPETGSVEFWFNDTAGLRTVHPPILPFRIGTLALAVNGVGGTYNPGDFVTATVSTRVTVPGNSFAEPNVPVVINVTDLGTGSLVPAYGATGLTTDGTGLLTYSFVLAATPTTADYEFAATGTAHLQSATAVAGFSVAPAPPVFTVSVTLDKLQYLSGDTIHATANVLRTETLPLTYSWSVTESGTGRTLATDYGATSNTFAYAIPSDYQIAPPGYLQINVQVNDGNGTIIPGFARASVAFGYLNLNLNELMYNAGDTITATYSLSSNVMTSPTYLLQIVDSTGRTLQSGATSGGSATFAIPTPAASSYTFTVIASQGGMSVLGQATAIQAAGYVLSISLDRSNYVPGDTMSIAYKVTTRGTSALPSQFAFTIALEGATSQQEFTTSPEGTLTLTIPKDSPTGNLLLAVTETHTLSIQIVTVHVGAVNPLVADIGGVPLFAILITLLFVVLLLAVILLWRRTGMGKAPSAAEAGEPTAPPPPPPSGPSQQTAGPMSVACKHCGASIEITTSKRPIEVMCPSCGETQVVQ